MHYVVQNGMLLSSNLSAAGTIALLENGAPNNSSPLTLNLEPDDLTCSGDTMHLYATDGSSTNLTRVVPKPPGS